MTSRPQRSVVDWIALVFTVLVAVFILGAGAAVLVIELSNPETDTSDAVRGLTTVITSILSALLGLLAGKSLSNGPR